jgi:putative hydrolase of the HAD superfamily
MNPAQRYQQQHLILDADDTLWENNIYFERAFDDFVSFLNHEHLTSTEILLMLDELEIANRATHGYGARAFARSLRDTFQRITGVEDNHPDLDIAEHLGLRILEDPFDLMDGVSATLEALHGHHTLYILTKGHEVEQRPKIERSGLESRFEAVIVTPEKTPDTYLETVAALDIDPAQTWMIGNSPRSDINPALAAGLNAIYIPHPRTWHLEVEELASPPTSDRVLLHLERFSNLLDIFIPTDLH